MSERAWLFVRGTESVRLVQDVSGIVRLLVFGPGLHRDIHTFGTMVDLASFQLDLEQRMSQDGWTVERFSTERRRTRDRRSRWRGPDRRLASGHGG